MSTFILQLHWKKNNSSFFVLIYVFFSYTRIGGCMRLSDLQNKDVVNVMDGKKVGSIIDVNINMEGKLESFIVEKSKFFVSMFSSANEIEVRWGQIEKIGEDVILVKILL